MKDKKYDIIIIGAGIIGVMIARNLSKYKLEILIIDKEPDIGMEASSRNSGILHSGHDPIPGTLKSELNIKGNKLWDDIARELNVPFKKTGSYVVAIGDEEFNIVKKLYERAILNGVPEIEIIRKNEVLYKEPKVNQEVKGALWTPTTGVIDSFEAVVAACENALENGVKLLLNTKFTGFIKDSNRIIGINTNNGIFYSRWVVNCSGLYSDEIMHLAGIKNDFKIAPVRGEYLIFDASRVTLNTVLYPVPTEKGKGTLVSTTTHGNVMIGPNASITSDKESAITTKEGLDEIILNAKKMVPSLDAKDIIAQFAGLRAKGNLNNRDFLIEVPDEIKGLVNLGGIESPGFVSAPAIAEKVIGLLKDSKEELEEKKKWNPIREARVCIKKLSHKDREALVKKNPKYGRIICRCEEVTEGEIIDTISSIIPAKIYDAVKKRTWLGTGRCQGAFDYPRVIQLLSKEFNIPMTEVNKRGKGSEFLFRRTKDL